MDNFAALLLAVSVLTTLATQAIKTVLNEHGWKYASNTIAGTVAVVLSVAAGIGWSLGIAGTAALAFLAWLCAMLGYDKVMQAIAQITEDTEDE